MPPGPTAAHVLTRALRRVLRPLVRLLVRHGVTLPELAGLLRELYVGVADEELAAGGRRATDSRVSLRTGIHRKEVRRLRAGAGASEPAAGSLGAQLVERWLGSPELCDEHGWPLPLPRSTPEGGGPSFEALVRSVSRDIRPRTVLDDWVDTGLASVLDDRVALDPRRLAAGPSFEDRAAFFAEQLRDHMAAGAQNLMDGAPLRFDRSVQHGALTEEMARELEALSRELAMAALRTVDQRARELRAQADAGAPPEEGVRLRLGIYLQREPMREGAVEAPGSPGAAGRRPGPAGGR
jgi:hypothetical protein